MRKLFAILGSVALVLTFAVPVGAAPAEKTEICHFPGHWITGGTGTYFDWIIQGDGTDCVNEGGEVVEVNDKALAGHQVNANTLFRDGLFGKSVICHYPGHGSPPETQDAILNNGGAGGYCFKTGGKVMIVADSAVEAHDPWNLPPP